MLRDCHQGAWGGVGSGHHDGGPGEGGTGSPAPLWGSGTEPDAAPPSSELVISVQETDDASLGGRDRDARLSPRWEIQDVPEVAAEG